MQSRSHNIELGGFGNSQGTRSFATYSKTRFFAALIAAVGVFWLAWQIITIAVADFYALSRPELALAWDPDHAEALMEVAEQQLPFVVDKAQQQAIANLAGRAMIGDPLSAVPLRVFALIAEANGDDHRADSLMRMAAARSLRDVRSQIWLADYQLLNGNYSEAFERIDALLRVWPELGDTLFPVLTGLAIQPESSDVVISALQENPPWRRNFFAMMPKSLAEPSKLSAVYSSLMKGSTPPTTEEVRPYLQVLIEHGEAPLAYAVWQESLPPERRSLASVTNGEFDHAISNSGFDWRLESIRGAQAKVVSVGNGGQALKVEFYNTRVPFRHVSQVLLLAPGTYRLLGRSKANHLQNERGLQWTVSCARGSNESLGETERMSGTFPWIEFAAQFEVPDRNDCQTQVLQLQLAARIPVEQKIVGDIWFDGLQVERVFATDLQ